MWAVVVTTAIVIGALLSLTLSPRPSSPVVPAALPGPSTSAFALADSLANSTAGGPWVPFIAFGYDLTFLETEYSGLFPSQQCPMQAGSADEYTIAPYNGVYSTGLAEGWLIGYSSSNGALALWAQDGAVTNLGETTALACQNLQINGSSFSSVISSTTAAATANAAPGFATYVADYGSANATYSLGWHHQTSEGVYFPVWTITFLTCVHEEAANYFVSVYATNGTIDQYSGSTTPFSC